MALTQPSAPVASEPSPAEAPAAPPAQAAPEALDNVTVVEEQGRTSYEFSHPDARETAPAAEAPKPTEGTSPASDSTPPEGKTQPQGDPDLGDDDLEKIVKNPKVQARIDQLANNLTGNKLQKERERLRSELIREYQQEQRRIAEVDEAYQVLVAEGRDKFMEKYGIDEAAAVQWEARYLQERKSRGQEAPVIDRSSVASELAEAAIEEFRGQVEALPFYGDLPDDAKKVLTALKFDPNTNWLEEGLGALAAAITARDERTQREHQKALDEARKAGANAANAEREEASPVVVDGKPNEYTNFRDAERDYGAGLITRERFHAEKRRFRIDY